MGRMPRELRFIERQVDGRTVRILQQLVETRPFEPQPDGYLAFEGVTWQWEDIPVYTLKMQANDQAQAELAI